jgi:prohibitin 2
MFNRVYGVMPNIYPDGTHFRIPWVEWPVIYDCRTKPLVINSTTGSRGLYCLVRMGVCVVLNVGGVGSDLQVVQVSVRVLSRPRIEALPRIYRTLGQDYDQRVLPSVVNEILKAVVVRVACFPVLSPSLVF